MSKRAYYTIQFGCLTATAITGMWLNWPIVVGVAIFCFFLIGDSSDGG